MKISRSHRKALGLASLVVLGSVALSACVATVTDYDDDYYPAHRTVVVKHTPPVYQRVEVYETQPTVIVARPRPHYYHRPEPVVIHKRPHHYSEETYVVNPGRHQQQEIIVKPNHRSHHTETTVIKGYRPHNKETHIVQPTSSTEVKQPKKIVIESQGDAPPSTLSQ